MIKDLGGDSFYRGQTAAQRIGQIREQPSAAEIEYLDEELSGDELAGLYTACNCLVHPYRGEGFGLPIAEAMACGLPVIVTGYGAALAEPIATSENARHLIPARIMRFRKKQIGDLETVDYPYLAEPDTTALCEILRAVVENPEQARAKGTAGEAYVRGHLTWDHSVNEIEARLQQLTRRPIRRFCASALGATANAVPSAKPSFAHSGAAAKPVARQRVSLCMIVKNEAERLSACLGSIADLVDEMVVVDTGSTDATAEVAARLGAKIHSFAWVDSFAAARNETLRHAQGDWVLWLDGDETLDEQNRRKLRSLLLPGLKDSEIACYVMRQRSPARAFGIAAVVADQVRLFRRLPEVRWSYRVHEQILPSLRRLGAGLRQSDIVIQHSGHEDPGLRLRKLERDLRLLLLEQDEERLPDDPFYVVQVRAQALP